MMKSFLVVDDSKVIRSVARRILEDLAFQVLEAENGQVALDMCKKALPDAILLDWNMPVMDGIDFLEKLKAECFANISDAERPKIIFCTTENDLAHINQAIAAGADEYIMKPFDSGIIESKLLQTGLT